MNNEQIKALISDLLAKMGVSFRSVDIKEDEITKRTVFIIRTSESGILIGDRGETFFSLSHIIKKMVMKGVEMDDSKTFSVDVNDYQSSIVDRLKNKALILANRARDLKSDIEMEPMSSYERLVVHDLLGKESGIKTESTGEGKERRVVIKYVKS
jgi:spoIIIJ-associated protein